MYSNVACGLDLPVNPEKLLSLIVVIYIAAYLEYADIDNENYVNFDWALIFAGMEVTPVL